MRRTSLRWVTAVLVASTGVITRCRATYAPTLVDGLVNHDRREPREPIHFVLERTMLVRSR